ncbi:MAG: hypothetical protein M1165_02620 [Candidatus Pacearchaeota archaeon]|nr:hypothetical protein [Candidatus Pacearchaeota archaeon]MDE1848603.1 hypothetical protein [Nanoarchaeota archaeon]
MSKSQVLMMLSGGSFLAILFTPAGTNYWKYLLILGILLGIIWLGKRD